MDYKKEINPIIKRILLSDEFNSNCLVIMYSIFIFGYYRTLKELIVKINHENQRMKKQDTIFSHDILIK